RSNQRIEASVKRAGEVVELKKKLDLYEKHQKEYPKAKAWIETANKMLDPEYKKKDGSKLDKEEKDWIKQQIGIKEKQIISIEKEHRFDLAAEQENRRAQREKQEKEEEAERERQSKI